MNFYIKSKIIYPKAALDKKIEGNVRVRFVVEKSGEITNVAIIKGIHPDCDSLALNIIRSMPKWIPGKQGGLPVPIYYTLPVKFEFPENRNQREDAIIVTEPMPNFPGGEEALNKFVKENLDYPESAINNKIQGQVIASFAIAPSGDILNIRIKESLNPACDSAVTEMIKKMPKWIPVSKDKVSADFTLPITFRFPYKKEENMEKPLLYAEKMPEFPGGQEEMFDYIERNLRYPLGDVCVQGRVIVRFVVTKEGKITKAEVLRGIHPAFDKEAIRVIESMPDWIPGMQNGKNIDIYYAVPVKFRP